MNAAVVNAVGMLQMSNALAERNQTWLRFKVMAYHHTQLLIWLNKTIENIKAVFRVVVYGIGYIEPSIALDYNFGRIIA